MDYSRLLRTRDEHSFKVQSHTIHTGSGGIKKGASLRRAQLASMHPFDSGFDHPISIRFERLAATPQSI